MVFRYCHFLADYFDFVAKLDVKKFVPSIFFRFLEKLLIVIDLLLDRDVAQVMNFTVTVIIIYLIDWQFIIGVF